MISQLSISTVWASASANSAPELLDRMAESGLKRIEIDFRVTPAVAAGLPAELKARGFSVSSVHNFCPAPPQLKREQASGDVFNLASPDKEERLNAVKYTSRTMELASDLEARAVVLHAGSCNGIFKKEYLEKSVAAGEMLPDLARFLEYRAGLSRPALDAVSFVLDRLLPLAEKLGLKLGLENRFHPHECPNLPEARALFGRFAGAPLGFWFDLGHALVHQAAGITPAADWLAALEPQLMGCHLHDLANGTVNDHQPPGQGDVDWPHWCRLLAKAPLKVAEIKPGPHPRALEESLAFLRDTFMQAEKP